MCSHLVQRSFQNQMKQKCMEALGFNQKRLMRERERERRWMAYVRQHPLFSLMLPPFTFCSLETSRRRGFIAQLYMYYDCSMWSTIFMPPGTPQMLSHFLQLIDRHSAYRKLQPSPVIRAEDGFNETAPLNAFKRSAAGLSSQQSTGSSVGMWSVWHWARFCHALEKIHQLWSEIRASKIYRAESRLCCQEEKRTLLQVKERETYGIT